MMTPPTHSANAASTGSDSTLDGWMEALRGQPATGAEPSTRQQAQALRQALRAAHATHATADTPSASCWPGLLFRLRREGLLAASAAPHWRTPLAAAAAAAMVMALSLTFQLAGLPGHDANDAGTLRGGGPQVLEVSDGAAVAAAANALQRSLVAAGARVQLIDIGHGAMELAATTAAGDAAAVARALEPLGLQAPGASGALRVEVRVRKSSR